MVYFCVPKPFDASTKFLVEMRPEDWIDFLNLPLGRTQLVDADVSTITAAGDKIVQVETLSGEKYGVHFEFQAGRDPDFVTRLWKYNVLYTDRLDITVQSVAFLLRSFEGHNKFTGRYVRRDIQGKLVHDFRYGVLRVWQESPDVFLNGGLALLPLAAVAKVAKRDIADVVSAIDQRLNAEAKPSDGELLRTATFVLLGLKYPETFVETIMSRNVLELSSTYQAVLKEGMLKGIEEGLQEGKMEKSHELLLRLGRKRLGEPSVEMLATLESINDVVMLDQLIERVWEVESWSELLPTK
jgi:hypothetical protein